MITNYNQEPRSDLVVFFNKTFIFMVLKFNNCSHWEVSFQQVCLCQLWYELSCPLKNLNFGPFKWGKHTVAQNFFSVHQAFPRPHNLLKFHTRSPGHRSNLDWKYPKVLKRKGKIMAKNDGGKREQQSKIMHITGSLDIIKLPVRALTSK